MCGRYIIITKIEKIEKRFNVSAFDPKLFNPSYNVSHGDSAPVITQENPKSLSFFQFGFTPHWGKKQYYQINARSEGDKNKDNNPLYTGRKGIFDKPMFRHSIRSKRCLVIADCFVEGPQKERLDKPYVVYLKGDHPFSLAGIYDQWINIETGEEISSFAIITAPPNNLMEQIGHHRSPVIVSEELRSAWLDPNMTAADISQIMNVYPSELMNAYPISSAIKNPTATGAELIVPTGQRLNPEHSYKIEHKIGLQGMGKSENTQIPNREDSGKENHTDPGDQLNLF